MSRATILTYHNIGIPPKGAKMRGLYVAPTMFRFQMWYLKVAGFKVVSLKEIIRFIDGSNEDENLVAITFDDGYQDIYENAYPVVKKYGYPATVFVVSDLIGKENLWDHENLNVRKRLLDWDTILELKGNGVDLGSHTKTHPFLTKLSANELDNEIIGSMEAMEERLKCTVESFCYPYGDYDERAVDSVRKAGYKAALTTRRGFVHKGDNPLELRRVPVNLNTHPLSFINKLHSDYEVKRGT